MMRKLAVTVFVLSLAGLGCGSDDGTPAKKDATVQMDTSKSDATADQATPDAPGADTADVAVGPETQVKIDGQALDVAGSEANPVIDGGKDTTGIDGTTTVVDGGADAKVVTPVDGGVDGGGSSVDVGSAG